MTRARTGIALVFVFGVLPVCFGLAHAARTQRGSASTAQSGETQTPAPAQAPGSTPAAAAKSVLDNFAWLEGRWRGDWGPRLAEQAWLGPKAGEMLGVFRLAEGDKTLVIELFALVEQSEGVDFYIRHFTPQLLPWEKSDATVLNLAKFDTTTFDFENPSNAMPKRSVLTRIDADTFISRSDLIPENGEMQIIEITYHREKPAPEKPSAGSGGHQKKP
jgi:Domain of unknown function (DUF6265)